MVNQPDCLWVKKTTDFLSQSPGKGHKWIRYDGEAQDILQIDIMADNRRSQVVTQGVQRTPNRAMLRAVGFGDQDFNKPIVGVANGYSTITPCNMGLDDLAKSRRGWHS
jgi:hypothetical protein